METRRDSRRQTSIQGRYYTGLGTPVDVMILDLSHGGCRFVVNDETLRVGTPLQLHIGSSGPYRASVRWANDGEVGVRFVLELEAEELAELQCGESLDPDDMSSQIQPPTSATPLRFC